MCDIPEHAAVAEVAVVGVEEEGLVKPRAHVVLRVGYEASDALAKEIQDWARALLAKHKYPRVVVFERELPKNDRGKIDRKLLKQ